MIRMFAFLLAGLSLAGAALPSRADDLEDYLRQQQSRGHIPGLAVAVLQKDKLPRRWTLGEADLSWSAPVAADTRFQLASGTKPFTGLLLMRLVASGKLSLDDPLGRFFPDAPPAWQAIRVRHLADHRSGLPMGLGPDAPVDVPGKVQAAMRLPLRHPPGDQAAYGFLDYVVLGRVLEIAGGAPLEELMRAYVFAPLGLRDTVFDHEQQDGPLRSADILPHRARTYGWDPGAGRQRSSDFLYPVAGYAAGGLYSSLRDLEAVMTALQGDAFLDPVARDALWTGPTLADGSTSGFALGWTRQRVAGHEAAGHSGGPALSDLLLFPEDGIAVVVLCNQRRLMPVIAAGVAERLLPRQAPLPPVADAMPALSQGFDDLLRDAAAGAVSADRFDGAGQREALPFLQDLGQVMLASLGPVETRRLVEASAQDALVRRVYGTRHDGFWRYWELVTDAAGRIHAFRPWTPPAATAPLAAHG